MFHLFKYKDIGHLKAASAAASKDDVPTSVTVNGGLASLYPDNSFAKADMALLDGACTFTAIAQDANGRLATSRCQVVKANCDICCADRWGDDPNDKDYLLCSSECMLKYLKCINGND